ncbi:MAG: RelA/SpoT family protein [Patescibacteria group bacterium]
MTIDRVVKKFSDNHPGEDVAVLYRAFEFANAAHKDQARKNGDPYIQHPLHTAYILAEIKADLATIASGLLHDVPEDTPHTLEEIDELFGPEIASLVGGITKLGKIKYRGIERYRENLRRMFLAMTNDLRVVFIKFCDRLNNLRTIENLPPEKQKRIAKETMEIYVPIAGLLGIARLKWQMEDICFKILYPDEFQALEYKYEVEKKVERNRFFQKVKNIIVPKLKETGIEHSIEIRFKHLYSIHQKMQEKNRKFDEIYDVFALRIIVPTIDDCYKTLGIIHTLWKPKPHRFKDYVAVPKPNGYRSIHTTIIGPENKATEFQIRTKEMHEESLYGLAAHWYYKNKTKTTNYAAPHWVKEIIEIQKEISNTDELVKKIKLDIFRDRIFVFSPKGDVFELPEGATPVDFAYAVHTNIGNKASGALINDKLGRLDQELKNGDFVKIITEKNREYPNRDWLKFVRTRKARERIKQYTKKSRLETIKRFIPGMNRE